MGKIFVSYKRSNVASPTTILDRLLPHSRAAGEPFSAFLLNAQARMIALQRVIAEELDGWHTLSRIFLLTDSRIGMISLQYLDAEGLI